GFFWALTIAGFIQGQAWMRGIPEVNVIPMIQPFFMARALFGAMIVISGVVQAYNIFMTIRGDTRHALRIELMDALPDPEAAL
ncbi:MAG: hypothetical protein KC519_18370, partial [Anaerolineae bacterium]|nr:hypothetical protein [Anaerolineae bacterium]